jgi:NitT/TauT family transport system substrate-binding protein
MRYSTDKTRSKRWGALLAVVLAFAMVTAACGDDEASDDNVTLTLPFGESMSFFETMMGDELGYFVDEGLNLEIQTSDGGSLALQQVISGQSDFAFTSPGLVLTAAAEGNQLISLATRLQKNIFSVVVTDDSPIQTTEDLRGGVLGVSDFAGGEMPLVRAALSLAGLTDGDDVEVLAVGDSSPAVLAALQDGTVDAYAADWFVFFGIEQSGTPIREIIPAELANLTAEVLVATPQYVEDHPDVVERMLTAMAKAAYFTTYDRDAALNILRTRIPEEHEDTAVAPDILALFLNLAAIPESGGVQTWGVQSAAAWETWKTVLGDVADTGSINVADILDSSFIDKANDIDFDAVEKDADDRNLSYP